MNDLRYGLRRMARSPLFHLAAVTALGLGIGANTAIFSLVNAVLLRQLPFQNPEELVGDYRPALPMLQGVVAAVLLMTCANLANLLLAQRAARQREMEIRSAVGASRGRLVRQLLMEGLLLATAGGLVGLGVAVWGVGALAAWSPASLPRAGDIALDGRVLAFTTGVSLLVGLACGLLPALPARGRGSGAGVGAPGWWWRR